MKVLNLLEVELIKLLKSSGLLVSASGVSKTIILSTDPDEVCNRLKLILQKKPAGKHSNVINNEIAVIGDKL